MSDRAVRPATWVIGDAHAGADDDADRDLVALIDQAAEQRVDLLIMGDLFVAWLGPERFWSPRHRPILEALRRARRAGGRVRFVVGNRDYLTSHLLHDVFDEVYSRPTRTLLQGIPVWVLHGDGIVPEDRAYRLWRGVSRSRAAEAMLARLPSSWGIRLPEWVAGRLSTVNRSFKVGCVPESALVSVARQARAAGVHHCLMGHFHEDRVEVIENVTIRLVPGWRESRRIVVVSENGNFEAREIGGQRGAVPKT